MLSNEIKNNMLATAAQDLLFAGLIGSDGQEIQGGDPAYARKPVTWDAPANGILTMTSPVEFHVPFGVTIDKIHFFSVLSGGTMKAEYDVADELYGGQGTYKINSLSIDLNQSMV